MVNGDERPWNVHIKSVEEYRKKKVCMYIDKF